MVNITKKKTTHYTNDSKYDETKGISNSKDYKFTIGDHVIYHGGLYDNIKGKTGTITRQSSKGHRIDYSVKFDDENNTEINCVLEKVLEKVEVEVINENINNIIESENSHET